MARARFSQADVTRAYRGAIKVGMSVQGIEFCRATGSIVVIAGQSLPADLSSGRNEWDQVQYGRD